MTDIKKQSFEFHVIAKAEVHIEQGFRAHGETKEEALKNLIQSLTDGFAVPTYEAQILDVPIICGGYECISNDDGILIGKEPVYNWGLSNQQAGRG